jgi:hypothetical protein
MTLMMVEYQVVYSYLLILLLLLRLMMADGYLPVEALEMMHVMLMAITHRQQLLLLLWQER